MDASVARFTFTGVGNAITDALSFVVAWVYQARSQEAVTLAEDFHLLCTQQGDGSRQVALPQATTGQHFLCDAGQAKAYMPA